MAMKHISDKQVCEAYLAARLDSERFPYDYLMEVTGQPFKVCYRCMERACDRGMIEYGVSLRTGWLTEYGFRVAEIEPFKWCEGKEFVPIPYKPPNFNPALERMAMDLLNGIVDDIEEILVKGHNGEKRD
ncbi:hypothetical protein CC53_gp154 [Rhizobium phage vB_RleS_L338C]|uniref:hypothetical protein n=1 Tax=Rhizobium phage vB_RleS_L338C TaxID=1414737 RepID=UPI0003D8C51B|nr:hypothetical protein CC53_gp154 [Rhizobium phage vB_RleS_L338C]AHC30571.1 hypothetical protein L338C_154 [Rhizobium phage vB_RleS_L338C]QNH72121.1 hypothetical protein P11VFA_166 [Rhizobium phage P11VFA]